MSGKTVDGLMELVAICRNFPSSARAYEAVRTYAEALAAPQAESAPVAAPLTDEQIFDLSRQWGVYRPNAFAPTLQTWTAGAGGVIEFARAIERALSAVQPAGDVAAPPGVNAADKTKQEKAND